ncbi:MAG: hypothetical protein Q8P95_03735 [bacterium]|nr:hypothetical protein [bacterium]
MIAKLKSSWLVLLLLVVVGAGVYIANPSDLFGRALPATGPYVSHSAHIGAYIDLPRDRVLGFGREEELFRFGVNHSHDMVLTKIVGFYTTVDTEVTDLAVYPLDSSGDAIQSQRTSISGEKMGNNKRDKKIDMDLAIPSPGVPISAGRQMFQLTGTSIDVGRSSINSVGFQLSEVELMYPPTREVFNVVLPPNRIEVTN